MDGAASGPLATEVEEDDMGFTIVDRNGGVRPLALEVDVDSMVFSTMERQVRGTFNIWRVREATMWCQTVSVLVVCD